MQNQVVVFNNKNLSILGKDNQFWLSSADIARALDYSGSNSITNLYNAHKEEFDQGMSEVIESMTSKNMSRRQRFFNREGAWLIGMFARTPKAAEFRKWVLKVLGAVADNQLPTAPVDMRAIGGMVKRCVNKALAEFLLGEDKTEAWQVDNHDLLLCLQNWYHTRNMKELEKTRELIRKNEELETKLRMVKQAIN